MELQLGESSQTIALFRNILNVLSASSEDYFFLWDIDGEYVYFSENARQKYTLLDKGNSCSFEDWGRIVYPRDLPALLRNLDEIRQGKKDSHEMVYRVFSRSGEIVWVKCRGSCYITAAPLSGR